jgi:hypothetical protein
MSHRAGCAGQSRRARAVRQIHDRVGAGSRPGLELHGRPFRDAARGGNCSTRPLRRGTRPDFLPPRWSEGLPGRALSLPGRDDAATQAGKFCRIALEPHRGINALAGSCSGEAAVGTALRAVDFRPPDPNDLTHECPLERMDRALPATESSDTQQQSILAPQQLVSAPPQGDFFFRMQQLAHLMRLRAFTIVIRPGRDRFSHSSSLTSSAGGYPAVLRAPRWRAG